MRKKVLGFVFAAAFMVALAVPFVGGVTPVSAKVHGVSQAGCANNPALSGANQSGGNSPEGPIPFTVGGAIAAGEGGNLDGGDGGCDAPGHVRAN